MGSKLSLKRDSEDQNSSGVNANNSIFARKRPSKDNEDDKLKKNVMFRNFKKSSNLPKSKKYNNKVQLSDAVISRLASETHFNAQEVYRWHVEFIRDCPDGRLSRAQFSKVYKAMSDDEDHGSEYIFAAFDTNNDGNIDFEEFLKAISVTTRGTYNEKLEMVFRMYDLNHDGLIYKEELQIILKVLFNSTVSSDRINEIFNMLDIDGDNKISKSEFISVSSRSDDIRQLLDETYTNNMADF
ncbi:hypothetical protein GJ496_005910 [Pomphorhynchus laevis]|nr:hypothetical protein GJ496_005910 [Pomphorhynchus laevis]